MVAETPRIETERLVLRRWDVAGDLDAYAAICGDPEVMRYIGDGSVATRPRLRSGSSSSSRPGTSRASGSSRSSAATRASSSATPVWRCPDFLPEILPAVEIGWRLGRAHWGHGFATEAARAALAFAWDPVGLDRVVSVHAVGNDASGNVMQKIGMHLDRETVHPKNGRRRARLRDRPARYALTANAAPPARADARIASSTRMHASPSANVGTGTPVGASWPSMPARSASHKRVYGPTSRCV